MLAVEAEGLVKHYTGRNGDLSWAPIGKGFAVIAIAGAIMVALNVRTIRRYD